MIKTYTKNKEEKEKLSRFSKERKKCINIIFSPSPSLSEKKKKYKQTIICKIENKERKTLSTFKMFPLNPIIYMPSTTLVGPISTDFSSLYNPIFLNNSFNFSSTKRCKFQITSLAIIE